MATTRGYLAAIDTPNSVPNSRNWRRVDRKQTRWQMTSKLSTHPDRWLNIEMLLSNVEVCNNQPRRLACKQIPLAVRPKQANIASINSDC